MTPAPVPTPFSGAVRAARPAFEPLAWAGAGGAAGALLGVSVVEDGRAVAVGEAGVLWLDPQPRVAPLPDGIPHAVWADGASFAVAVGYAGIAYVWEGNTWTKVETGVTSDLHAVWGRRRGDERVVYAGGAAGVVLALVRGEKQRGWRFERMKAPDAAVISAFAGAGNKVWAVGQQSGSGEPADGLVLELAGDTWVDSCPDIACGGAIYGAWAASGDELWTAGIAGELVRYVKGQPEWILTGTREDLTGVWGSGPADVFVIGDGGTCLHHDGKSWMPVPAGDRDLRAIHGSPSGEAWAVGADGTILRTRS